MGAATVTGLCLYPVKSARGIALASVMLGTRGFVGDREWMVVDARGRFVSQRSLPVLAQLSVERTPTGLELSLGPLRIAVSTPHTGAWRDVAVWADQVQARDAGDDVAAFLYSACKQVLRLVWMPPEIFRPADAAYVGSAQVPVSFADGFPLLLTNQASLDALNSRLPQPIPMERFRPNLVIAGWPAFAEDGLQHLRCGGVEIRLVKPCTRCSIPSLDHHSGAPSLDPTPVLKSFRYASALRGVTFGVNAMVVGGASGLLSLGDPVQRLD